LCLPSPIRLLTSDDDDDDDDDDDNCSCLYNSVKEIRPVHIFEASSQSLFTSANTESLNRRRSIFYLVKNMPPNIKFPSHLPQDDIVAIDDRLQASLDASSRPAHSMPIATADDVMPTTQDPTKSNEITSDYFHHDIEDDTRGFVISNQADESKDGEHKVVRTVLRKFSSIIRNPNEFTIDEKRLQQTLSDAGRHAYGLQGIAVWIFDFDHDRLVSPLGGFWYHPENVPDSDALERLVDTKRADYIPITPVAPGTDIAGLLWSEVNSSEPLSAFFHGTESLPRLAAPQQSMNSLQGPVDKPQAKDHLIWRDLKSLVQDPDTANGPRTIWLEKAGFGQAAGVPFQSDVSSGLIIFFAKTDVDQDILNGVANVTYLRQSAQFIGAAAAMTEARRAILGQKLEKHRSTGSNVLSCGHDDSGDAAVASLPQDEESSQSKIEDLSGCSIVCRRLGVWIRKVEGGRMQIPPPLSFRQSLWTAFGTFVGLLVLSSLNEYYKYLSDEDYYLLIGPFGAMVGHFFILLSYATNVFLTFCSTCVFQMTLCYALTAAPASQPRNAVMGQAVAGAVSLLFTYVPEYYLPVWLRRAVGPAIAIGAMARLGIGTEDIYV
jgi:HPP family